MPTVAIYRYELMKCDAVSGVVPGDSHVASLLGMTAGEHLDFAYPARLGFVKIYHHRKLKGKTLLGF